MNTQWYGRILAATALVALTSCSKANWVDAAALACEKGAVVHKGMVDLGAKQYCAMSGKAYTGEFRCKGDTVQVKCE